MAPTRSPSADRRAEAREAARARAFQQDCADEFRPAETRAATAEGGCRSCVRSVERRGRTRPASGECFTEPYRQLWRKRERDCSPRRPWHAGVAAPPHATRRMISEALVPPNPNELDSTVLIGRFFAVCGTRSI